MKITKNDKARVIVQAVYNLVSLPAIDDKRVVKTAKFSKIALNSQYEIAHRILTNKVKEGWLFSKGAKEMKTKGFEGNIIVELANGERKVCTWNEYMKHYQVINRIFM